MISRLHRLVSWSRCSALALGGVLLVGCVAHRGPPPVYYPDRPAHRPHVVHEDQLIADRVWAALRSDRQLDSRGLSVHVAGAVVTIGGYAPTITNRDRALYTASRVPGVRSVVNQMTLN